MMFALLPTRRAALLDADQEVRLAAAPRAAALRAVMAIEQKTFTRASDVLSLGERVTQVDVVNVLGRWQTVEDWDTVGALVEMDKLFDASGTPLEKLEPWSEMVDGRRLMSLSEEEKLLVSPARSPNRRAWCKRNGQAQRWWHNENVPLLRFTSAKLAASVGMTVTEMNARKVNPLALEVVFDALAQSQSGIVLKEKCNARRALYETRSGAFDSTAFAKDLARARKTVVLSYAVFPGVFQLVALVIFFRVDGYHLMLEYFERFSMAYRTPGM
ncbi:hypothetical protein AB1Y20_017253 [Prymnesium parvum]|uniref:Uncharacterized protein n=1 Tax=Prymnesium parvum TaxID=97485 RepID=A0AB34JKQ2_PRYPA